MKQFTPKEQAAHCRELANRLKRQPKSAQYNHSSYTCGTAHCAMGWAAVYGVGGLCNPRIPHMRGRGYDSDCHAHEVFGYDSYSRIFSSIRVGPKRGEPRDPKALSIHRLREQAKRLLKAVP